MKVLKLRLFAIPESTRIIWIKTLIILGFLGWVLLFSFSLGTGRRLYPLLVAGIPLSILGVWILNATLDIAPVIILVFAAFVPFSLPTGTGSRLVASLVITAGYAVLWLVRKMLVEKRISLYPFPVNRPLLGFIGVTVVSLIWSNLFRDLSVRIWRTFPFVQVASALVMILLPVSLLIVANLVQRLSTLKWMVGVMLFAGVIGLIQMFGGVNLQVNTGGLFLLWVIALSASLILFNQSITPVIKVLLGCITGAAVLWGFGLHIQWIAGWLPGIIALIGLTWLRSKKLLVIFLVVLVVLVVTNWAYFSKAIESEASISGDTRLAAWRLNWKVTAEHWLFGTGPGGYAAYYMTYFPGQATATHSNYMDILAQTGVVGLAFYLWLFGSIVWFGVKLWSEVRGKRDFTTALTAAALTGTLGCLVIMAFGDWLIPFAYTQTIMGYRYAVYNWLFMGTLFSLSRLKS